ncbi:GmrSD restriction endonuclease domain-containing protein [Clostridium beijerinckii]|uniref:DUF262 domain-containing protein n=1 Tax=Clostridium beijerinckii TaxID=1520 RepID=A0AAW3WA00_CLOBE|nr:DUF262 domain-containing protein [Clostridium beijerinckii]MBC2457039.1 DUF262 domain-containing protein [Clostridium beijerinckii]MBC2475611.1 DUF262 domain-containing protein [Clostridium beijerinckii]NOV63086.1 hypothetical protein [Clostridium beijerinckii]NOV69952.1 hypothetical protein [Clostridium beijerinckii]NOW31141.1 hypothetical protein [Clostridium beijerinckii]
MDKRIDELESFKFVIPSYQRGYRWNELQVKQFIEDIYEDKINLLNTKNSTSTLDIEKDFNCEDSEYVYCIQPLIIREIQEGEEKKYNVVDGQQRLTTIFIMIAALRNLGADYMENFKILIEYKSREKSKKFLEVLSNNKFKVKNALNKKYASKNIDFDYMISAFTNSIKKFKEILIENKLEESKENYNKLLICLLHGCKFIWYPIDANKDEREQFSRINMGRIELTNSELIKAEFMNPKYYGNTDLNRIKEKQISIAEKWYDMETKLHNPDFWAFVPHQNQYEITDQCKTRIDIIFDFLIVENWLEAEENRNKDFIEKYIKDSDRNFYDYYYLYNEVKEWINKKLSADRDNFKIMEKNWEKVQDIFENLNELYEDDGREQLYNYTYLKEEKEEQGLCNLVGFLIYISSNGYIINEKMQYLLIYVDIYEILKEIRINRILIIKKKISEKVMILLNIKDWNNLRETIQDLKYQSDNEDEKNKIHIILLLYNIILLSNAPGIGNRYNFLRHKKEKWSIEHIFAQKEKKLIIDYQKNQKIKTKNKVLKKINKNLSALKERSSKAEAEVKKKIEEMEKQIKEIQIYIKELEKNTISNKEELEKIRKEVLMNLVKYRDKSISDACAQILGIYENINKMKKVGSLLYVSENKKVIKKICFSAKNQDMLFSEIIKYKEDRVNNVIGSIIEGQCNDIPLFIKRLNEELQIQVQIEDENQELNSFLKEKFNILLSYIDTTETKELIKQKIKEVVKEKFEKMLDAIEVYRDEVKIKVYEGIIKNKEIDEIKNSLKKNGELKSLLEAENIDELKRNLHITKNNKNFLEELGKMYMDISEKTINDFFEQKYNSLLQDNSIGNLTLLSNYINSGIGNEPYMVKKEKVYEYFKKGAFIPLSTMMIFTDIYMNNMEEKRQWLPESRDLYLKDMLDTICGFWQSYNE